MPTLATNIFTVSVAENRPREAATSAQEGLRCELVSDFGRLQELSPAWQRLWQSDPQAEVFQTPEWAIAWWHSFGHDYTLSSLVISAGDEIVGIVPLVKRDGVIQFLGTPEADYADIVCAEEWTGRVLTAAFQSLLESTGWNECRLHHLSNDSRVMRHYRELPRPLLGNVHCTATEHYQMFLPGQDGAGYDSVLGKHHTKRIRNKLQKAGQVRFRHLETQAEAESQLVNFFDHHVRRFAGTGRQSIYAAPEARQLLKELVEELGLRDKLRFGVLELDGRPLAWHFGFEANGKFLLYQHTFDGNAAAYTPGEFLLWNLLAYSRDRHIREFDFGSGDELYKNRFSNSARETFSLFVEPRSFGGRIRGLARRTENYVQPLLRNLKTKVKTRATMRAVRSLRRWKLAAATGSKRNQSEPRA